MKTVKVERPDFVGEEHWDLNGYSFEVDDAVTGFEREMISRRANALGMKALRGVNIYEDEASLELLAKQCAACMRYVGKVFKDGEELTDAKRAEVLDSLDIVARDALANEVVGANALGLKKE